MSEQDPTPPPGATLALPAARNASEPAPAPVPVRRAPAMGRAEGELSSLTSLREFATADPRSLGLFRILFGVFLLVDLYRRLPDYVFFYTNEGMLPNHGAIFRPMSGYLFSVYHAFSTRVEVLAAFAATAVVYVLYAIGYRTRLMQVLVLVLATSLHSRNIMLENGGDVVCNILALWTAFLPLGRRFSLDAMRASMRARHEHDPAELNDRSSPLAATRPFVSLAYAAIVLNVTAVYFFNVVHKDGVTWRNSTSVHFVLWADRLVEPLGVWVRMWLPPVAIQAMTLGTLVIESSIVALLLSPIWLRSCRRVAALLIIALHSGFQTVGHFGLFSFVMMLHAPLLLGPEDWDALARRMRARLPYRTVFYDATCGFCHQVARVLKRLDPLGRLRFVGSDEPGDLPPSVTREDTEHSIVVTDSLGARVWMRNDGVTQILRALPYGVFAARLLELPGLRSLAGAGYDAVAARRHEISAELGFAACGLPQDFGGNDIARPEDRPPLLGRAASVAREAVVLLFVVALASQVLAENRKVPKILKFPQPPLLAALAQYPRFFQGWSMFAPIPPMDDGVVVVDATTVDGRHIDPLTGGKPVDFALPRSNEGLLVTQFWYEFHDRIRREANAGYRQYFRDWIIGWQAAENRPASDRIVAFDAYWVYRQTQAPFSRRREETHQQKFFSWSTSDAPFVPPPLPPPAPLATPPLRVLPRPPMPAESGR